MMMNEKISLLHLAWLLEKSNIRHLVISPGSRNAPIITIINNKTDIKCHTIVDERSAAFFALGIAQQLNQTVAIVCTSGSAVLNYAPAIAEAYYQRVSLLVLTADRPVEWIDQADGQTIRQQNIFSNYIRKSVQLPQNITNNDDLWYNDRLINEAILATRFPVPGPVHINIPIREPLYGFDQEMNDIPRQIALVPVKAMIDTSEVKSFAAIWNKSQRKMILIGQHEVDQTLNNQLIELSKDPSVIILTETISNMHHPDFIGCIDRCLGIVNRNSSGFEPDLLLTTGGAVVSKQIKTFLRKAGIQHHWHIDPTEYLVDTYQHLTFGIPLDPSVFFGQLLPEIKHLSSSFSGDWQSVAVKAKAIHQQYLADCGYSDLKIFEAIFGSLPEDFNVQIANSTPVRYAQLFDYQYNYRMFSNRGTSGIDGCVSTAAGAASASNHPTLVISGDLGFFYDSNALWNSALPANLKIIVINNEGGGIFRFLPGPDTTGLLESHFEARQQLSVKNIASTFDVNYYTADNLTSLLAVLPDFFKTSSEAALLEINSPAEDSANVLRDYFTFLKKEEN
ncbi:MAG: 2-succinyl-5-enolpyruvyl-6-hydroxy-3-cyclohexene-1-carboxylic-acid synthase [Bacteroidales bacterium]|nr:2-succinyl-5-enolpyruvyl-6-hydroxy-3-cyclohexene-1-carboxylic-acid synthase [Bacteroidales bacterium]